MTLISNLPGDPLLGVWLPDAGISEEILGFERTTDESPTEAFVDVLIVPRRVVQEPNQNRKPDPSEPYFNRLNMERKKPIKKNHIKEFGGRDAPEASQGQTRDVPGTPGTFGPDLCVNQY